MPQRRSLRRTWKTVPGAGRRRGRASQSGPHHDEGSVVLALFTQTPVLLAVGYLMRAVNRFELDRSDAAYDDLEAMLQQLGAAGIDNELSQWAWAMVHIHRKRDVAADDLSRPGQSPHLSAAERMEIARCSDTMRGMSGGLVLFGASRAQLVIIRALIARAGECRTSWCNCSVRRMRPRCTRRFPS